MSTNYTIAEDSQGTALEVLEHSNLFDIDFSNSEGGLRNLTLEQLAEVIVQLGEVLSYFDEELVKDCGMVLMAGQYPYKGVLAAQLAKGK